MNPLKDDIERFAADNPADRLLSPKEFMAIALSDPASRRSSPPPMTEEERAELLRRIQDMDNSITLDELLATLDLEEVGQNSGSQS